MSNFNTAIKILKINEGGYNNDPRDAGGETYVGITRRYQGNWSGWAIIDAIKKTRTIKDEEIINNVALNKAVDTYYKNSWDVRKLELIQNTGVASLVFDTSTQHGNWGRVVYYALFGLPQNNDWWNDKIPTVLTTKVINSINANPNAAYTNIANARKLYVQNLLNTGKLNQGFKTGVMARINKFITNGWQYLLTPNGISTTAILIIAGFFF